MDTSTRGPAQPDKRRLVRHREGELRMQRDELWWPNRDELADLALVDGL